MSKKKNEEQQGSKPDAEGARQEHPPRVEKRARTGHRNPAVENRRRGHGKQRQEYHYLPKNSHCTSQEDPHDFLVSTCVP